jgi:STE24 endopeptidase
LVLTVLCLINLYKLWELWLERRSFDNPIPDNVTDVYDRETYLRWKKYSREKSALEFFHTLAGFVLSFLLLLLNTYSAVDGVLGKGVYPALLSVTLFDTLASWLIDIPFGWHDTMKIEETYGFNRSSSKTFVTDQIKQLIISCIIACGLACMLAAFHGWLGAWLPLVFAVVLFAVVLFITFLFPVFSKIFNKFTPLEEGELRTKLTEMLEKHGYKVRDIKVMDASRRTTKSNAYFTGFGKMKTIVLYDTLVEAMEPDEICAVFAHEMGHGLHKDTLKNQIITVFQMLIIGVLAWLTLRNPDIFTAFGFDRINYGFAVLLIMTVEFALISPLFMLIANAVSRKAEYRADEQAVKEGYAEQLVSALKKLARQNFSDLSPHPALVLLEYSHPTLAQRVEAIEKLSEEKKK